MSIPNTHALSLAARQNQTSSIRQIFIGKDAQPVNLPTMALVNSHSWGKAASFATLKSSVYTLASAHTVSDLVPLISGELPHDTGAAFQEATSAAQYIMDKATMIENLEPVAFLSHTGKEVIIDDANDLKVRPEDITF